MKSFSSFLSKTALLTILTLPLISTAQAADTYNFDPFHTAVVWHANHFGFSNPSGKFTGVSGSLVLDQADPSASTLDVTIDTASLSTGLPKFDEHLKSKDFLNIAQFPNATFKSNKVTVKESKTDATVEGTFTLLGVSKPLTLDVHLNKLDVNAFTSKKTAGFTAHGMIKRSDFGMSYGVPGVSDEVALDIEVEANPAEGQK